MPNKSSNRSIVVMMTVHNRVQLTTRSLNQVHKSQIDGASLATVLVDDGSSDGTMEQVENLFPEVKILHGSGALYWTGGMRLAESYALATEPDLLLWLNDDIDLDYDALNRLYLLWARSENPQNTIMTGALVDPVSSDVTYSGYRRKKNKLLFRLGLVINDSTAPVEIDTFNGNLVLIPRDVAHRLGGISSQFTHHYADFDYGLRAKRSGVEVLLAPGTFGRTARNGDEGSFRDRTLRPAQRLNALFSAKGFPAFEKKEYLSSHGTKLWRLQWVGFYAFWVIRIVFRR